MLGRRARGQLVILHHHRTNIIQSAIVGRLVVTHEVINQNHLMADSEQGPTEKCTVCHTVYPQCSTCSKYGRRGVHPLDMEKSRNAHDNPSFTNDSGTVQPHWMKKDGKSTNNSSITDKHNWKACGSSGFSYFLYSGLTPVCI